MLFLYVERQCKGALGVHGFCMQAEEGRMFRRTFYLWLFCLSAGVISAGAQTPCTSTKLACLLPFALHTNQGTFNFFNETFATQIGQLPLATPASGFIFTFDKKTGVYHSSQDSFGPMVAERSETIGRHKLYVAFTYQRFGFDELDGNSLGSLPLLFTFTSAQMPTVYTETANRIDSKVNQYVVFGTYGITSRVDGSVAIPINRVSLGVSTVGDEYSATTPATVHFTQTLAGEASGFGDVVLAGKGTLYKSEKYGVAVGMELRLPTGDAQNFLGSGATGIKPYLAVERRGKIAPHLNLLYQWNSSSALNTNSTGAQQPLPGFFGYTLGADMGLLKSLTVDVDLVGQHFFNSPRITQPVEVTPPNFTNPNAKLPFSTVQAFSGDYEVDNLAVGIKFNPWRQLLLMGNATVKLNDGGLRSTVVPLVGASYSF
jgi:hypothetical protein